MKEIKLTTWDKLTIPFSKDYKDFIDEMLNTIPEIFYQDGERVFTEKEEKYMKYFNTYEVEKMEGSLFQRNLPETKKDLNTNKKENNIKKLVAEFLESNKETISDADSWYLENVKELTKPTSIEYIEKQIDKLYNDASFEENVNNNLSKSRDLSKEAIRMDNLLNKIITTTQKMEQEITEEEYMKYTGFVNHTLTAGVSKKEIIEFFNKLPENAQKQYFKTGLKDAIDLTGEITESALSEESIKMLEKDYIRITSELKNYIKQSQINKNDNYLIFKATNENVSNYNRSTKGFEFIGTINNIKEFKNKILELESNDYYEQKDGSVLDANGNEVYDVNYPERFDDCDYNYYCEKASELNDDYDAHKIRAIKLANPYNLKEILYSINQKKSNVMTTKKEQEIKIPYKNAQGEEKETSVKVNSYVSAKKKDENRFVVGKIVSIDNDKGKLVVKNAQGEHYLNQNEVELMKMFYGQRFDKRELPENYEIENSKKEKISIAQLPYKDMQLLLEGKKTNEIYTLVSKKEGQEERYDVRLQLDRTENGILKVAPSFRNVEKIKYEKYQLNEEEVKNLENGQVIQANLHSKETGEEFQAYLKKDNKLNTLDYLTVSRFEKQVDLTKDENIKNQIKDFSPEERLKFLNGKIVLEAQNKSVKYDFRNGALDYSFSNKEKKEQKNTQKQQKTKSKGVKM